MTTPRIDLSPGHEDLSVKALAERLFKARRLSPEEGAPLGLFDRGGTLLGTATGDASDLLIKLRPCLIVFSYEGVPELPDDLRQAVEAAGRSLSDTRQADIPHGSDAHKAASQALDAALAAHDTDAMDVAIALLGRVRPPEAG